jgi:non-specific serine/threonine protein kinase
LLTRGNRAGIPRHHQTLQAAVDWSYLLCAKPERLLWQRASVFAGGFDLDAAQRVCGGFGLDPGEVLESVSGLADKSVLLTEERAGRIRYRLLDTIRQYGSDRLMDPGDVPEEFAVTQPALRRRHLDWYADLAGQFDADWTGPRQREWIEQITADAANIRAALAFALQESPHVRQGLRLATGLYYFWRQLAIGC